MLSVVEARLTRRSLVHEYDRDSRHDTARSRRKRSSYPDQASTLLRVSVRKLDEKTRGRGWSSGMVQYDSMIESKGGGSGGSSDRMIIGKRAGRVVIREICFETPSDLRRGAY